MACLNVREDDFSILPMAPTLTGTGTKQLGDQTTIEHKATNAGTQIIVRKGTSRINFPLNLNNGYVYRYHLIGPSEHIIVLGRPLGTNSGIITATHIDHSTNTLVSSSINKSRIMVNNVQSNWQPIIHVSKDSPDLFMAVFPLGSGITGTPGKVRYMAVRRSDNNRLVCEYNVEFSPKGTLKARVKGDNVEILDGLKPLSTCSLLPDCGVVAAANNFPDITVGPDADPVDGISFGSFTVTNKGNECLTVDNVRDGQVFTIVGTSPSLPLSLDPGESMDVRVSFTAQKPGTVTEKLPIEPVPVKGARTLDCTGTAKLPKIQIVSVSSLNFGSIPTGTSKPLELSLRNTGQIALDVSVPESKQGAYQWDKWNDKLKAGEIKKINLTFRPSQKGNFSGTFAYQAKAKQFDKTYKVSLKGEGCVEEAKMEIRDKTPIQFGEIQKGFRAVRHITIENTGNGTLNASVSLTTSPSPFGIQKLGGSVTRPEKSTTFAIKPENLCGGTGDKINKGKLTFAITYHASGQVKSLDKNSVVIKDVDNNKQVRIDLQAEISKPILVDAELLIDTSGSMANKSGDRQKNLVARDAAGLFVGLFRDDNKDRIGIHTFSDSVDPVQTLTALKGNKQNVQDKIKIDPKIATPKGYTSIGGALWKANKELEDNKPNNDNQIIVLLTDGKETKGYKASDGNTYDLDSNPPKIAPDRAVHTVGIDNNPSLDVLKKLYIDKASKKGKQHQVSNLLGKDYFAIEKFFTQIFMNAVDMQPVKDPVYTLAPYDSLAFPFTIGRGDLSLMVVMYDKDSVRLPFYLESSSGEVIDITTTPPGYQLRSGITASARFVELQLPQGEPHRYAGDWTVMIKHDGQACVYTNSAQENEEHQDGGFGFGFTPKDCQQTNKAVTFGIAVGAGSNFRMDPFVDPALVRTGQPIHLNATVSEFRLPVTGCNVTVQATDPTGNITSHTLLDDGSSADGQVNDGNYGLLYPHTPHEGFYSFLFTATGRTRDKELVTREQTLTKYVVGPGFSFEDDPDDVKVTPQEPTVPTVTIKELGTVTKILWAITTLVSIIALWLIIG